MNNNHNFGVALFTMFTWATLIALGSFIGIQECKQNIVLNSYKHEYVIISKTERTTGNFSYTLKENDKENDKVYKLETKDNLNLGDILTMGVK